ncbi:Retinol dehydrogenase [Ooceraea biroi]|nr:Retinol dehydrogenase [Ooceraea biroi]
MDVVVACRRPAAGEKLVREIRKSGTTIGRAKVRELNLSSVKSIKAFADWVQREYGRVHMLINNAAVMFPPTYTETEDGFEEQWGVNYLSHFLLTALLLPCLQNAGQTGGYSRIVNVSSCALDIATIDFDYIRNSSRRPFNTYASYGQSKLAQIMFTLKLDKLLRDKSLKVQAYCVHPGIVRTDLFKETLLGRHKWLMIRWKTAEEGATPIVYTAVNKEVEYKGGLYISNCKELPIPPHALVEKTQKELFDLSLEQLQLRDFFQFL